MTKKYKYSIEDLLHSTNKQVKKELKHIKALEKDIANINIMLKKISKRQENYNGAFGVLYRARFDLRIKVATQKQQIKSYIFIIG